MYLLHMLFRDFSFFVAMSVNTLKVTSAKLGGKYSIT